MQKFVLASILLISAGCVICIEKYTTKYDNIDIDQVLNNDRLLKKYVDCGLDRAPCTKDAQILKDHIADALLTDCTKCSEKQMLGIKKVVKHLATNKKSWWNELTAKYDPDSTYRKKYEELLRKEGVSV